MFLHKKKVQLSKDWFDTPTWLPFYSFVIKQYGGRDVMLNEYEWQPTTVVMMAPISPNQSERSIFGLDQSESRISPM